MKRSPAFALFAAAAILAAAAPVKAQFGTAAFPRALAIGEGPAAGKAAQPTTLVVYPLSAFDVEYPGGNVTKYGILASVEKALPSSNGRSATVLGGWYWSGADTGIYELHAKHYFTPQWGVQAGVIGGTRVAGFVTDGFLLYNLDGRRQGHGGRDWSMQIGLGAHGGQEAGFTGFWQGSINVSTNWSLNASYWYIRETPFDFHRFALGAGYRF